MLAPTLSRNAHLVWMQVGMLALSSALALMTIVAHARFEPETRLIPASWQGDMGEGYAFAMIGNFARTLERKALDRIGLPRKLALPPLPKPPAPNSLFPAELPSRAAALVKHLEERKLAAYRDAAGILTIGYGHTGTVANGSAITAPEADALLDQDLHIAEDAVRRHVRVALNVNEYSALVSLVFNIGEDAFARSSGLDLLNQGERRQAAKAFLSFNKARVRGTIAMLSGLVRRRRIEEALFLRAPEQDQLPRMVLVGEVISIPVPAQSKPAIPPMRVADAKPMREGLGGGDEPQSPLVPRRGSDDVAPNRMWFVA